MSNVKDAVKKWADKIGRQDAVVKLVTRGVSPRVAEQLCAGTYASEPKSLREKLEDVLTKDGFSLAPTRGKAS